MKPVFLSTLFVILAASTVASAQDAKRQPADDVPQGEIQKFTFDSSKIFPGTTRDYWIYVPKQYDPATPACLYVAQDGIQHNAPAAFDQLIAKKEIPVLIGVFVRPGVVKATSEKALDRFNRSYEYDGLGDNYVRFLLEELLPEVEKKTTKDGRAIKISKSGNDRCIGGESSGAVCAFTAAWERPDAFSRVFSAIGTYVGIRGGNVYPTLIRKFEPKPLRVYLQDGENDLNIYAGDWWLANQEMERALKFAGYEVNHDWGKDGHNGKHATKIFPEAMRWLWKDWPTPVKAGAGSEQMKEILLPGEGWKEVGKGYKSIESVASNAKGEVYFNELHMITDVNNPFSKIPQWTKTHRVGVDGKTVVFLERKEDMPVNHVFGPDGRLYFLLHKKILAYDAKGKSAEVASAKDDDGAFTDFAVGHDGTLYLHQIGFDNNGVTGSLLSIKGEVRKRETGVGLTSTHGLVLSPDQSLLYVGAPSTEWIYSYQVQADGSLAHKQRFVHLHLPDSPPDWDSSGSMWNSGGMCVDRDGRLYVATAMGVQICDQAGRVNCIVPTPNRNPRHLCFGGPKFDILYVTFADRIYARKLKTRGANAFEAPNKPAPPRL